MKQVKLENLKQRNGKETDFSLSVEPGADAQSFSVFNEDDCFEHGRVCTSGLKNRTATG